jgi:hypothetical protein
MIKKYSVVLRHSLDSELNLAECGSLNNSIALLEKLTIESSRVSGFSQIFGGNRLTSWHFNRGAKDFKYE